MPESEEILHIVPDDFTRPSLYFEEVQQEDGTWKADRQIWGAVSLQFTTPDPYAICRWHEKIVVENIAGEKGEKWEFHNARISPAPNSAPQPMNDFVLTFERCIRVVEPS